MKTFQILKIGFQGASTDGVFRRDVCQGTDFSRAGPDFSRGINQQYTYDSFLPKAGAELPVLERSALKEGIQS